MAGCCTAFVRKIGANSRSVNIPFKFWGLEIGSTYRVVLRPLDAPSNYLPFCFDATLHQVGSSARITIPKGVTVEVGDSVSIWVGKPDEYGSGGDANGRGYSQAERTKYLEEQADILRRCARQPVHNEWGP